MGVLSTVWVSTVTVAMMSVVSQEGQAASCHQDSLLLAPLPPGLARSQKSVPEWAWSVYLCVICVFYFGEKLLLDARLGTRIFQISSFVRV